MKISISQLGALHKADITLKPLTVFVGENGTGKTWAAYTLAAILGDYGWGRYVDAYLDGKVAKNPRLESLIDELSNSGATSLDLVDFINSSRKAYYDGISKLANQWLNDYFSTSRVNFDRTKINVKASNGDGSLSITLKRKIDIGIGRGASSSRLRVTKRPNDRFVYFYTEVEPIKEPLPQTIIREFIVRRVFAWLAQATYSDTRVFPTERSTFVTVPIVRKEAERQLAQLNESEEAVEENINSSSVIHPVGDIFRTLISAYDRSVVSNKNKSANSRRLTEIADLIEKSVIDGNFNFVGDITSNGRELIFKLPNESELEMSIASSMVKELAPLVLYLRYVAQPGELIVIDEPEMNLHPLAQVRMAEALCIMANAGLNLIITTHSPYIVDHLMNLSLAAKHQKPKKIAGKFFLKREDAFLASDKMSVYLFQDNQVVDILNKDGIIDWKTFSQVSDQISQMYFDLLDRS